MVRYPQNVSGPPITSVIVAPAAELHAWLPSTWPAPPLKWDISLITVMQDILRDSIFAEIDNVIADAEGDLEHRGHVVVIALLCALDTISSYGYGARSGRQIPEFIRAHFPKAYRPHAKALLALYQHTLMHSWNLFGAALSPGNEEITKSDKSISFGVLNFRDALVEATQDFLRELEIQKPLQRMALKRYAQLKASAKP